MSLIVRQRAATAKRTAAMPTTAQAIAAAMAANGVDVTQDSAMEHPMVWSCRTKIAQDVSMMPVDVVRYVNGTRQEVSPLPQVIAAPSVALGAMDWRYQVLDGWLADGNAYGIVTERTANGLYPLRVELLAHRRVRYTTSTGTLRWYVDNVEHQLFPVGDLWHVPAFTVDGSPIGLSPIGYHRATIGAALAAAKYGSEFFEGGGHPTAIVSPKADPGEDGAKALKARILNVLQGSREPLILPQETTYEQIQTNPSDSQFIELMQYDDVQICRIYGEDPVDHGATAAGGRSLTYANRRDNDLARLKRRQFWVTKLQDALTDMIPRPQVAKLNTSVSLMMTPLERHELHKLRLESKTTTVNDVKKLEDEAPFPDAAFDQPGIPGDPSPDPEGDPA